MIDAVYIVALSMTLIDVVMMSIVKLAALGFHSIYILLFAMLLFSIQPLLFFKGLSYEGMGIINSRYNVLSTVLICLIGYFVFDEKISNKQILGIIMSVVGIALLHPL